MAKRVKRSRRSRQDQPRSTNWLLIGGIIGVGVIGLFVLLYSTLREQDSPSPTAVVETLLLSDYCEENPGNCVTKGADDAPVTIIEVSDYGCSHCKNFNLETAGLLEDLFVTPGQVKWIVLPFALRPETAPASVAAMCAADQDRFFEFHQGLFELQGDPSFLTPGSYQQLAAGSGLDVEAFQACFEEGKYNNVVQQNVNAATAAGINATPTFFINDAMTEGNLPLTAFQQQINAILGAG